MLFIIVYVKRTHDIHYGYINDRVLLSTLRLNYYLHHIKIKYIKMNVNTKNMLIFNILIKIT